MIRIAYIVDSFAMGGLERCMVRLINCLDPDRYEPVVICLKESGGAAQWMQRKDVPILELRRNGQSLWRTIDSLGKLLKELQIDIAHSHNWATLVETSCARRQAGVLHHLHAQHGMFFHADPGWLKQWLRRQATRWAVGRADCLVVVDDSVRDYWLKNFGTTQTPVHVVTNGVDIPQHDPTGQTALSLRATLGIPKDAFVVGSVGRLVPVKGYQRLIQAVKLCHDAGIPVHALLVGDGVERPALAKVAADLQVQNFVHFSGEQAEIGDWLKAMNLYINCSFSEGMNLSILEAMSLGFAFVVTDAGANRRLIGGEHACGIVVPVDGQDQLAAAILELHGDPARRRIAAANGQKRFSAEYDVHHMVKQYERLYDGLMHRDARAPEALPVLATAMESAP